ncbi:DNA-binding IclR family transcriptional regulator [Variovorax boronicumulans]|uniref:DNA-binding IclR family transcriptional regulator n=1 Tax=Variovorax boronicumulans TaxID=436515 RepID=A0AAW8DTA7_9BURK|nr:helix-turn-helix domain-containing protein [Variovorax boronicumulans]MDP9877513.1 DNA-binding IclR family transcriptional regulator [Variovorax boronicumulans]MDP9922798.1 DNA-binding IclR family transcriptional regulator [Variovorax boronicumulans]
MIRQLQNLHDIAAVRSDDPNFAGALAKGLLILQSFLRDPRPRANSELAATLGLPRPTVSRLCRTLVELGYLDRDERIDRYFIGPMAVALSYPYIVSVPMRAQARLSMQALANQVHGAASIGVAIGLDVVYIETCAYQRGTLARPDLGALRSVAETAIGRAWLGSLDDAGRQATLQKLERERPQQMARCAAAIRESLATQAQRGFATNFGDAGMGVQGVAVASRIRQGTRSLLFNCAVPGTQLRPQQLVSETGPALIELVRACERSVGIN